MPLLGEIRMFGGNFPPQGWMLCQGQQLAISENTELFALIGTTYGGDGRATFALPDLRSRVPVNQGTVSNVSFTLGERGGAEAVALSDAQMPAHTHPMHAVDQLATSSIGGLLAAAPGVGVFPYGVAEPHVTLAPPMLASSGGSQPHENLQPYVVVNFIIASTPMSIMTQPFYAEIRIFPYSSVPNGWAACNGQLLPIAQNTQLFSLLGTAFGGDGRTTFALPDLRAATPMGAGQGIGLSERSLGETGGSATVTLIASENPAHSHAVVASAAAGTGPIPSGLLVAETPTLGIYGPPATMVPMSPQAIGSQGGGQPHNNLQPYLAMTFCIALTGVMPVRG